MYEVNKIMYLLGPVVSTGDDPMSHKIVPRKFLISTPTTVTAFMATRQQLLCGQLTVECCFSRNAESVGEGSRCGYSLHDCYPIVTAIITVFFINSSQLKVMAKYLLLVNYDIKGLLIF